jgi:uncharacterized protein (UPF0147 family)
MAAVTVELKLTEVEFFKQLVEVIRDIKDDERIPAAVREEHMNKVKVILES